MSDDGLINWLEGEADVLLRRIRLGTATAEDRERLERILCLIPETAAEAAAFDPPAPA